jgi:D-glycero-alpha-D-manno-heptose-7-phosphate kinase
MILARAPLRISLGGGGTDLPSYYSQHGGFILSAAIDKYVYICVNRPAADQFIRLKYSISEKVATVDEVQHDLVRPTLKLLQLNHNLEIVSMADVPAGTGLGSSGSYLVALLAALYELKREKVPMQALAEAAFHIEANLAHHPVGKHDMYLAAFGGVTCLDIAKDGTVAVSTLDGFEGDGRALEFRNRVMLFFTGQSRSSGTILEQQKQQTEKRDPVMMDSLHRTKELGYRIRDALMAGDLDQFGLLLDEHWQNKKRRAGPITDARLDQWYDLAKAHGALGGKIIGAGGGGFFMICCKPGCRNAVREALVNSGLSEMPYGFDHEGAKVLVNL